MPNKNSLMDFSEILRTLHIVNRYFEKLRKISASAPIYGVDRASKAQTTLHNAVDELVAAVGVYSIHNLRRYASLMLREITDEATHAFPDLNDFNDKCRQETVDYGVYIMLQSYVERQLKEEFPSIIGVDISYQCIPDTAAAIILPELGSTSIVFQGIEEAEACFNMYAKQFNAHVVSNAHSEAYTRQSAAKISFPGQRAG